MDMTGYLIGSPYFTTVVGEFENSESPYGTFDQGGNLVEWNETAIGSSRGGRGGHWENDSHLLPASYRYHDINGPAYENEVIGFRVASVPEPVFVAGDADMNGKVDIFDVAVLQTKYGTISGATWADGDFDGNGTVDIFDVALMQHNYGKGVTNAPAPVPEPSTLVLAVLGLAGLACCRRFCLPRTKVQGQE